MRNNFAVVICCLHAVFVYFKTKIYSKFFRVSTTIVTTTAEKRVIWGTGLRLSILVFLYSGRKCWTLGSGRWTLDAGCWTMDSECWTLGSGSWAVVDYFRIESEPSFWFCLIKLLKILWVRISKDIMVTFVLWRL